MDTDQSWADRRGGGLRGFESIGVYLWLKCPFSPRGRAA